MLRRKRSIGKLTGPMCIDMRIDIPADADKVREETEPMAKEVVRRMLEGQGVEVCADDLCSEMMQGAATNVLYSVATQTQKFLVRIFGDGGSELLDRDLEKTYFRKLSDGGVAPHLFAEFANGRIVQFLRGRLPIHVALGEEGKPNLHASMDPIVAREVARFHCVDIGDVKLKGFMEQFKSWYKQVQDAVADPAGSLSAKISKNGFDMEQLKADIELELQRLVLKECEGTGPHRLFYAQLPLHMDLHGGNLLFSHEECDVKLIDFEYLVEGPAGYDIANLIGLLDEAHTQDVCMTEGESMIPLLDAYPSVDERREFVAEYASARGMFSKPEEVPDKFLVDSLKILRHMQLVVELRWVIWGLYMEHVQSDLFPYLRYAMARYKYRYKELKRHETL